jgi:hypothetical protein
MSGVESSEVHGDFGAFCIFTGFRICLCNELFFFCITCYFRTGPDLNLKLPEPEVYNAMYLGV